MLKFRRLLALVLSFLLLCQTYPLSAASFASFNQRGLTGSLFTNQAVVQPLRNFYYTGFSSHPASWLWRQASSLSPAAKALLVGMVAERLVHWAFGVPGMGATVIAGHHLFRRRISVEGLREYLEQAVPLLQGSPDSFRNDVFKRRALTQFLKMNSRLAIVQNVPLASNGHDGFMEGIYAYINGERLDLFTCDIEGYPVLLAIDSSDPVRSTPRHIVDRLELARLLSHNPGANMHDEEYEVVDVLTGAVYGRYPGWWIMRHGLSIAVPASGVQALQLRLASPVRGKEQRWWEKVYRVYFAQSEPISALRREHHYPGSGKFTDVGPYYRKVQAKEGIDILLWLPHYAIVNESPYATVSNYALNEDLIDWSVVPEVKNNPALLAGLDATPQEDRVSFSVRRAREQAVALAALQEFDAQATPERRAAFVRFIRENRDWLEKYSAFMAFHALTPGDSLTWQFDELKRLQTSPEYDRLVRMHYFAQWVGFPQCAQAIRDVQAAGGKVLMDLPMFRGKDSVDVWEHPEYFTHPKDAQRYPGVVKGHWQDGQWMMDVNERWQDLALWNWPRLAQENFKFMLDPLHHWLTLGFNGVRLDALHFAFNFHGQLGSGGEPGERYLQAIAEVLNHYHAYGLAEAFDMTEDGRRIADIARSFGFAAVSEDWQRISDHDGRSIYPDTWSNFMGALSGAARQSSVPGSQSQVIAFGMGHQSGDPRPIKKIFTTDSKIRSEWRYSIPLPLDSDYHINAPRDLSQELAVLKAYREGSIWSTPQAILQRLIVAADRFVHEESGYDQIWAAAPPSGWFHEEWGRDAFVALPGLLLTTGRTTQAKSVLRHFARHVRNGIIPNRIWDEHHMEYNNADGSLWFMHALKQTLQVAPDPDFLREMFPTIENIVANYRKSEASTQATYERQGTHKIFMDTDGLIVSPAQATWMDADPKAQGAITPRYGKAVEINALWYEALRFAAESARNRGASGVNYDALADRVKISFNTRFWDNERGILYDVIDGDPRGDALRPNMLFAISHGGDLLSPERQASVLHAATQTLLTPYGLRTLAPQDPHYHGIYETEKDDVIKDHAYHEGTVWPWLMGTYIDSYHRVRANAGVSETLIQGEIRELLTPLLEDLVLTPAGTHDAPGASLSELRRGDWPYQPEGTPAQAWSVSEVLRVAVKYGLLNAQAAPLVNARSVVPKVIRVDPVRYGEDGSITLTAHVFGHNGFSPTDLIVQAVTHTNALARWSDEWAGLHTVPFHFLRQSNSGDSVYEGTWTPGPGNHECVVRVTAPDRVGDWVYAETTGNIRLEAPERLPTLDGMGAANQSMPDATIRRAVQHFLLDRDEEGLLNYLLDIIRHHHLESTRHDLEVLFSAVAYFTVTNAVMRQTAVSVFREFDKTYPLGFIAAFPLPEPHHRAQIASLVTEVNAPHTLSAANAMTRLVNYLQSLASPVEKESTDQRRRRLVEYYRVFLSLLAEQGLWEGHVAYYDAVGLDIFPAWTIPLYAFNYGDLSEIGLALAAAYGIAESDVIRLANTMHYDGRGPVTAQAWHTPFRTAQYPQVTVIFKGVRQFLFQKPEDRQSYLETIDKHLLPGDRIVILKKLDADVFPALLKELSYKEVFLDLPLTLMESLRNSLILLDEHLGNHFGLFQGWAFFPPTTLVIFEKQKPGVSGESYVFKRAA